MKKPADFFADFNKSNIYQEESHTTAALKLVYKLALLYEEKLEGGGRVMNKLKSPVSLSQKNNQMDHSDSHLVTALRLVYRLSALLEDKNKKGGGGGGGE